MKHTLHIWILLPFLAILFGPAASGQSIAVETDAIAYALPGYSAIVNLSLRNGLQLAAGTGRYEVPSFLLEGDDNYENARWKATSTSVQVFRVAYRFNGPMKNGPVVGGIVDRLRTAIRLGTIVLEQGKRMPGGFVGMCCFTESATRLKWRKPGFGSF